MIPPFLAARGLFGMARWIWLLIALAGVLALAAAVTGSVRDIVQTITSTAHEGGKAEATAAGHQTTFEQIGEAHEAGNEVRNDRGSARYDECLQSAAPGYEGNCERYRPDQPVPGDADDPAPPGTRR
ncbi:hypothetical protein [Alteraurantiacibacter buctensis]|uniref:Uncharacterized protein n=1 Tax=Alteraurantiacibacter buctensis TaxID=1503981 RepID=A0A844Z750_9SPHN|nr:hypothetical protein [Alteraurantiacibacter buctensis]MXO73593.1 hypothetical protein [Alteraurantiacibacter buctensis]